MRLDLVEWSSFVPYFILIWTVYLASKATIAAVCRRLPWELRPVDRREAIVALVGLAFAAVMSVSAFRALFVDAPEDFAKPETLYKVFPHARFVLWFAAAYFAYDLCLCVFILHDPMYTFHALFSGGGAVLAACSPRAQNLYCWLMLYNEATNIGLQVRALMIRLGFAGRCKQLFFCVELIFALSYIIFRGGVLVPRYVQHVLQIRDELSGSIPGVQSPASTVEAVADLAMNTCSVLFNMYWMSQIIRKMLAKFSGKGRKLQLSTMGLRFLALRFGQVFGHG